MTNRSLVGLLLTFLSVFSQSWAAEEKKQDLCFQVQLIWGVDQKQNDPKLTDVSPALKEGLESIFRWKFYYGVSSNRVCIPVGGSKRFKLSDKCEIEMTDKVKPMLEVKLFGEGVLMSKVTKAVVPNDLVLAGDDQKNKTAWFVVIKPAK